MRRVKVSPLWQGVWTMVVYIVILVCALLAALPPKW